MNAKKEQFQKAQEYLEEQKVLAENDKFRKKLNQMEEGYSNCEIEQYMNTYTTIYGPKPPFIERYVEKSVYNKETFTKLKQYDLPKGKDLPGTEISDKEFTALGLYAAIDPAFSGELRKEDSPGLTKEQRVVHSASMFTETAIYYGDTPRGDTHRYFDDVIQPARQKAMDAVNIYRDPKNPDPQKLGQLIAEGMNFYLYKWEPKPLSNARDLATRAQTLYGLEMLERDPKLKEAAMKAVDKDGKPLLTEQDLRVARGFKKAVDISRKNEKAAVMLEAERRSEILLTDEERRQYIKDRVTFETVNRDMENDLSAQKNSEAYATKMTEVSGKVFQLQLDFNAKLKAANDAERENNLPPEQIKQLKDAAAEVKGQYDSVGGELLVFDALNLKTPETVEALGAAGDQAIDALIDKHLPGADNLYELKGQALEDALKPGNLFADKSPYRQAVAQEPGIQNEKVQEQKQPEQGLNIG